MSYYYYNPYNGHGPPIYYSPGTNGQSGITYYPVAPPQQQQQSQKKPEALPAPKPAAAPPPAQQQPIAVIQPQIIPYTVASPPSPSAPCPTCSRTHKNKEDESKEKEEIIEISPKRCECHECNRKESENKEKAQELESLKAKYHESIGREKTQQTYITALANAVVSGGGNGGGGGPVVFASDGNSEREKMIREINDLRHDNAVLAGHVNRGQGHHHHNNNNRHHPEPVDYLYPITPDIAEAIRLRQDRAYRHTLTDQEQEIAKLKKERDKEKAKSHGVCGCGQCMDDPNCEFHKRKENKDGGDKDKCNCAECAKKCPYNKCGNHHGHGADHQHSHGHCHAR